MCPPLRGLHSQDAPIIAAMKADELMVGGDLEGARTFRAIVRRINELLEPSGLPH